MPISIGTSSISDLYIGTSSVSRVYVGSNLVYDGIYDPLTEVFLASTGVLIDTTGTNLNFNSGGGTGYTLSSGQVIVDDAGWYLISYSMWITSFTGSNRSEVQGGVLINGDWNEWSKASGYIRRLGSQEDILAATFPIKLSANDTIRLYAQRTDSNTALAATKPNGVGMSICKLPTGVEVITVSGGPQSDTGSSNVTTFEDLNVPDIHSFNGTEYSGLSATVTNESSNMSLSSNAINVNASGHYLIGYSIKTNNSSGSIRHIIASYLSKNGSPLYNNAYGYAYNRGSDGVNDGICTGVGLLELAVDDSIGFYVADAGESVIAANQSVTNTHAWMIKIPEAAVDFEVKGGSTSATAYGVSTEQILSSTISTDDDYLFVFNLEHNRFLGTATERKTPAGQINVAGASTGGLNASFNRGEQSSTGTFWSATSAGFLKTDASGGSIAELLVRDIEVTGGGAIQTPGDSAYFAGIKLSSLKN